MSEDLSASACHFLAAIAANTDLAVVDDVYRAISDLLPHHLRDALDDAWEAVA